MTRRRAAGAFAIVAVSLLAWAVPAAAHASLVSTSPDAGAVLDDAPPRVTLSFDEPVEVRDDSLRVVDASGTTISSSAIAEGSDVVVEVPTDVTGWFAVSWQVVSVDGHPLSGGWTYRVGAGSDVAPEDLQALADDSYVYPDTDIAWATAQWLSVLAALALVGTAFVVVVTPAVDSQRLLVVVLTGIGVATSFLAAGLNGPATTTTTDWFDGPASDVYLWRTGLLLAGGAALWGLWAHRGARLAAGVVLAAGLCVTVLSGHARADGNVAVVVVMAHLVVAGAWLGALPALALGAWQGDEPARRTLERFSRAAVWLAVGVVALGSGAAWALSGGWTTIATRWGTVLAVKVAVVALAIAAGGWTRWRVLGRWESSTRGQIRAPLLVEAGLLAAVAALSIALLHNGPPREPSDDGVVEMSTEADEVVVTLVVDPGAVGTNDWHLYVTDPTGLPVEVEEATIELSSSALGVAPIAQDLSDLGGGHFSGRTDDIGAPGTWEVRVVVRPTPFTQVVLEDSFDVG